MYHKRQQLWPKTGFSSSMMPCSKGLFLPNFLKVAGLDNTLGIQNVYIFQNRFSKNCIKDMTDNINNLQLSSLGICIRGAAKELNVLLSTAQNGASADNKNPKDVTEREEDSGKAVGRPSILMKEHEEFLHELIDEKPSLVISEIMDEISFLFFVCFNFFFFKYSHNFRK
ncbi:hypothetical protein BDF21DRAFT_472049 [Thamnidium elegans]|nr:hypothetical protein BDF21DRAFT_472049 [Thamnidium elegans]